MHTASSPPPPPTQATEEEIRARNTEEEIHRQLATKDEQPIVEDPGSASEPDSRAIEREEKDEETPGVIQIVAERKPRELVKVKSNQSAHFGFINFAHNFLFARLKDSIESWNNRSTRNPHSIKHVCSCVSSETSFPRYCVRVWETCTIFVQSAWKHGRLPQSNQPR